MGSYGEVPKGYWMDESNPELLVLRRKKEGLRLAWFPPEGRSNPKRDTADRLYLYAVNIAIEDGKPQPTPFELGVPLEAATSR